MATNGRFVDDVQDGHPLGSAITQGLRVRDGEPSCPHRGRHHAERPAGGRGGAALASSREVS